MTTGIKHLSPLRRRPDLGHDELVAYWREHHAPGVKAHMRPDRYSITFFDPRGGKAAYDGMAALAYDDIERANALSGRNAPPAVVNDGFVERVEPPITRFRVVEHVIVPGPGNGPASREERESAYKMTFFVAPADGEDLEHLHRHWLDVHAPNVASGFAAAGGVRYVVNLADRSGGEPPFAGVAELWYRDRDAFKGHAIADDGFNALTSKATIALSGREVVIAP
jgi:hypothetical protein